MIWTLEVILPSAIIGAIVSGFISFLLAYLDRRTRKKELIFSFAWKAAEHRTNLIDKISTETGKTVYLQDTVFLAGKYYSYLEDLYEKGKLPDEFVKKCQKSYEKARGVSSEIQSGNDS